MKRLLPGVILLIYLAGCSFQDPATGTGSMHGRVLDAMTGEGIESATVSLPGANLRVDTDADGAYSLEVDEGNWSVYAYKDNFLGARDTVVIEAGGDLEADYQLFDHDNGAASVYGYVISRMTQLPLQGVRVGPSTFPGWDQYTDVNGYYGFYTFPGFQRILFLKSGYDSIVLTVEPDTAQSIRSDQIMTPTTGVGMGLVTGTVYGANGPLSGASFLMNSLTIGATNGNGEYYLVLTEGHHDVAVEATGYQNSYLSFTLNEGDSLSHDLTLALGSTDNTPRSFVLDWETGDVDLILKTPEIGGTSNRISPESPGSLSQAPWALHHGDVPDGPEQISVDSYVTGTYKLIAMKNDTASFMGIGAVCTVQREDGSTLATIIAEQGLQNYWFIGQINGSTGEFTNFNLILNYEP